MKRGLFISVEGIDGAGKSTHVGLIQEYLESKGNQVITTREPGGTELGEKVRELLLHGRNMYSTTELLLMFASRQELIDKVIRPNLDSGVCVITDRFIDASIAYQAFGRNIGLDKVKQVINLLDQLVWPDLTFLFNAPLSLALERISRSRSKDRIEAETEDFFARVQNAYLAIAKQEPKRVKLINTNQPHQETREQIIQYLDDLIRQ